MKLLFFLVISLCCVFAFANERDFISLDENETNLRQRYQRSREHFISKLTQRTMASRHDFRNREPDEVEVIPCPDRMPCVNGICSAIHFRWGRHHEHHDFECNCDEGFSGAACDIEDKIQADPAH